MESVATVETHCKASPFPPRLGSLRLPHFPQPRRRIYLQTINPGGGSFLLDRGGLAKRKSTVEPVFGIIKSVLGFRQFHLRGLDDVSGEWTLVSMAWNLKRLFNLSRQHASPTVDPGSRSCSQSRKHRSGCLRWPGNVESQSFLTLLHRIALQTFNRRFVDAQSVLSSPTAC